MSGWLFDNGSLAEIEEAIVDQIHNMNDIKLTPLQHVTKDSLRFRSLSVAGLVISTLKFCCVSLNFVVFQFSSVYRDISLCSEKDYCVSEDLVVFWKRLLCFKREIVLCFVPMGHRNKTDQSPQFIKKEWALVKKKSTLLMIKSVICFGVFHTKVFDLI